MIFKRLLDLAISAGALLALFPVFCIIAILIMCDSPGTIFFRQNRVGRHGKIFRIHKFRTMHPTPPGDGIQLTVSGDKRITRLGSIIRETKLDELPQLIDVFLGNMSLVGPRPEVPEFVGYYPEDLRTLILSVKPGMTDYASLLFKDENKLLASADDPVRMYVEEVLPIKLRLSAEYILKRSLAGDIICIVKTLISILIAMLPDLQLR